MSTRTWMTGWLLAGSLSGCLGHNALVDRTLRYNLSATESRWGREALFVGLWVVPVYPICTLADLLVLNSIEFWAGENPVNGQRALVDIPKSEVQQLGIDGVEVARIERQSETRATLHVTFANGDRVTFDVLREEDRYTVSYAGVEFFRGRVAS